MSNSNAKNILKINSSGRFEGSYSRQLVDRLVGQLTADNPQCKIIERDVSSGVNFINEDWIKSNFTAENERTLMQKGYLEASDILVAELVAADTIVIGVPIYNFGIPAVLKAWVDQIARVNKTFTYTDSGPIGLLSNRKAYLIITSGGTKSGSEIDFATGFMRHILNFVGISDVEIIPADQLMMDEDASLANAHDLIRAA